MTASEQIDRQIAEAAGWQGDVMVRLRTVIHEVDPAITEEWKWNTAVFSHSGMVCALGPFKDHVKMNFFKGASLEDAHKLFNAGLDAKATRAIDIFEGDALDDVGLKDLVAEAVHLNTKK